MTFKQAQKLIPSISFLFVLVSSVFYFFLILRGRGFDWYYFDSLASVIKSSILYYHTFPMHDPWTCSGSSIIANPQNWIFSPTLLLTIIFPPTLGNLISILIFKICGFWGSYKYFTHKGLDKNIAFLSSALFINATWFALHFAVGHIPFRTFFLLPLVFFYIENLTTRNNFFKLSVLSAFIIMDGGIYSAIFSLVYFLLYYLLNFSQLKNFLLFLKQNFFFVILNCAASILVITPKIYPALVNANFIKGIQETYSVDFKLFYSMFFNPFLNSIYLIYDEVRFHEFGSYIGISITLLFMLKISSFRSWKKNDVVTFIVILFFFWVGVGWFEKANPYSLISSIPLINKAHIQSRYLIIFHLFFVIFVSSNTSRLSKKIIIILLLLANLEALVGNYFAFLPHPDNYSLPLITKKNWTKTITDMPKPQIYYKDGLVSKFCYEPSNLRSYSHSVDDKNYKGEIVKLNGTFQIGSPQLVPGEILLPYTSAKGGTIMLNTNYLDGWIESEVGAEPFNFKGLLGVHVPPGQGTLRLQYFPDYLNGVILCFVLGLIIMLYLRSKKNEL
jgi:hypothetical protein